MTLEEFDALPRDERQAYLTAAHGVACRVKMGTTADGTERPGDAIYRKLLPTGSLDTVSTCLADLRRIRCKAKGLDPDAPICGACNGDGCVFVAPGCPIVCPVCRKREP